MSATPTPPSSAISPRTAGPDFTTALKTLWFRLVTLGLVSVAFTEAVMLASGKGQGWCFYHTVPEVTFEVLVRLIAAAWIGIAAGTACTLVPAPFLAWFKASRP